MPVVVLYDIVQRGKSAVMVKSALVNLLRVPERPQRSSAIASVWGPLGLEVVDADLLRLVRVPAGFGEQRRHVASAATPLRVEDLLSSLAAV